MGGTKYKVSDYIPKIGFLVERCIYSIISLYTNESIAVWKKMPPQDNKEVA